MKVAYKYFALYSMFIALSVVSFLVLNVVRDTNIDFQKQALIKEAQTHFDNQQNTRKWSAMYGGVYAKPLENQEPNPYLLNNSLKVDENLTLIKINPAWMTRQLSELSDIKDFSFRITSLNPINPNNQVNEFEKKALTYIASTKESEYYELNEGENFNYMGALVTTKSCMPCHQSQGYLVGDIRGGISITLDTKEYNAIISDIRSNIIIAKILIFILFFSIALLIHKQIKNNEELQDKIKLRTHEIESTKELLQQILDEDLSFLFVANDTEVIFTNKTVLNFFGYSNLDEFKKNFSNISDMFEDGDNKEFLQKYTDGEHWTDYLKREQYDKDIKVVIKKDDVTRYFRPHTKEIVINGEKLYIITFDDITREHQKIKKLQESASIDSLTKLFNRATFDDVISKEISLSRTTNSPLSIIFLDIDHFKAVNDTHGHDVGDYVLIELAKIIQTTIRQGDFAARWGGEEFSITLQSTNLTQAKGLAEKIRKNVEDFNFTKGGKQTVSLGVTQFLSNDTKESFLKRVDEAMYEAKHSGRNKVVAK